MSKRNEKRLGYKKTKIGWIPEEWKCVKFDNIVRFAQGQVLPTEEPYINYYYIGPENIDSGTGEIKDLKLVKELNLISGKYLFDERAIIYSKIRPNLNKVCFPKFTGVCSADVYPLWVKSGVEAEYFYHFIRSVYFLKQAVSCSMRTGLPKVNREELKSFMVFLPPLPEQKKIAEILSAWDRAIELTNRLIEAKKKLKKGVMQQLLTGRRRFPEFGPSKEANPGALPVGWSLKKASEIFKNKSIKKHNNAPVLSVTQDQGVVRRDSLDRKINMSIENTDNYKLVEPGDFVISLRSFQGGLEYSELKGLVSPAYHVISPIKEIDDDFYKHYFKSYGFIGHLASAVIGIRDGKQISFNDFSFMKIPYPPLKEQRRIGEALDTCDKEIFLLEKKGAAFKKQKQGLMQKLLTGEVRARL